MASQKGFVFAGLILLTIIILIIVPAMWMGYGQIRDKQTKEIVETTLGMKVMFTLVGLFLLSFAWWNYFRQKAIDSGDYKPSIIDNKVMPALYKASGYYAIFRAVGAWILSGVLFVLSIAIFAGVGTNSITARIVFGLITFGFAVWGIFYGWIFWKRSKALVKGRFY